MNAFISMSSNAHRVLIAQSIQQELMQIGYDTRVYTYTGSQASDQLMHTAIYRDAAWADVFFGIIVDVQSVSNHVLQDFDLLQKQSRCRAAILLVDNRIEINHKGPKGHILSFDPNTGMLDDYEQLRSILTSIRSSSNTAKLFLGAAAFALLGVVVSGSLASSSSGSSRSQDDKESKKATYKPVAPKKAAKKAAKKSSVKAAKKAARKS